MALIGSVNSVAASPYVKMADVIQPTENATITGNPSAITGTGSVQKGGFGSLFENMIQSVDQKESQANAITQQVLLGKNDQLHQSVIAMQEASVAFSLMVEVRNKLVESYQELMRMQV